MEPVFTMDHRSCVVLMCCIIKKGSIRVCILDLFVSFNLHRLVYFKDNSHLKKKEISISSLFKKYI